MSHKILVVDDSALSRRILRRILEPAGHQVVEAEDGMVAIERYALERPDLVLLDLTMTGMHGMDVLHNLLEIDEQAIVIIASADVQHSSQALAKAEGASGFLNKPFSAEQVLQALDAAFMGGSR